MTSERKEDGGTRGPTPTFDARSRRRLLLFFTQRVSAPMSFRRLETVNVHHPTKHTPHTRTTCQLMGLMTGVLPQVTTCSTATLWETHLPHAWLLEQGLSGHASRTTASTSYHVTPHRFPTRTRQPPTRTVSCRSNRVQRSRHICTMRPKGQT